MDKVKIKFKSNENDWKYQLRVPNNLEWFEICRYYKTEEKNIYVYMRKCVHEEITFDCFVYYNIEHEKLEIELDKCEKRKIIKQTILDLINSLGINKFTFEILKCLNITFNPFEKYFLKNIFKEKDKYYLSEYTKDNKYKYEIANSNGDILGYYSNIYDHVNMLVLPNQKIEFTSFIKENRSEYEITDFVKTLVKRK